MTPYSQDLRQRVLDTVRRGEGSVRQIARRFLVSVSFVTRLLRNHRDTGALEPKPHGGGNPAVLTPEGLRRVPGLLRQQAAATPPMPPPADRAPPPDLIRQPPAATPPECRQWPGVSCTTTTPSRALG